MKAWILVFLTACSRGVAPEMAGESDLPSTDDSDVDTAVVDSEPLDTDLPLDTATADCEIVSLLAGNITLDGIGSDWGDAHRVAVDDIGDPLLDYTGGDLSTLYLAHDSTWLYIRLDVTESPSTQFSNGPAPMDGRYTFNLAPFGWAGLVYSYADAAWSLGANGAGGAGLSLLGPTAVAVSGTTIELKVLKDDIEAENGYINFHVSMENCCSDPWITVDAMPCVSVAWPPGPT